MNNWFERINLHLFDGGEGGGEGAAAGGTPGAQGAEAGAEATVPVKPANVKRGKANPLAEVVYGKQTQETQTAPAAKGTVQKATDTTVTPVATDEAAQRRAEFEKLVRGDYKDLYDESVKQHVDRRFKHQSELEQTLAAASPILDVLKQKYGVSDIAALNKAIEEDSSYWEAEADERGLTVEQLKEIKRLERENAAFKQAQQNQQMRAENERRANEWMRQSEEVARVYDGFDLSRELNHPETGERFVDLLRHGIDVRTAYEVIHKDELLSGAIGFAVRSTQQRTVNNIRARGMRPSENGASGNAAAGIVKSDPSKWTKQDRAEISRRVQQGARIEL